jgi:gamma-glutamyltranspeptidase/glutathione hydrolase
VVDPSARWQAAARAELEQIPGFADTFPSGATAVTPAIGERFVQPRLAATLDQLVHAGLDDFYRGDLARSIAADLSTLASPLTLADLERHHARLSAPLALAHSLGMIYNMPPPTQGLVSLLILGVLDRVLTDGMDPLSHEYVHACVEATKLAFSVRDRHITDADYMDVDPQALLEPRALDAMAQRVWMSAAAPA